jgi:hypothetical protein
MTVSEPSTPPRELDMDDFDVMGPIDYIVVEFPHRQKPGEGLPIFVDLVENGTIRVLDLAFVRKEDDGNVRRLALTDLGPELAVFEGASAGYIEEDDVKSVGDMIEADSTAAVLIYENRWAAPLARAMRRGGGQLAASGRLSVQGILAALDETETPYR